MSKKKVAVRKDPVEEAFMGLAREALRAPVKRVTGMIVGVGAMVGLFAVQKYVPRMRPLLGRMIGRMAKEIEILAAIRENDAAQAAVARHLEASEPRSLVDERQLGRSEVIREIARGKLN